MIARWAVTLAALAVLAALAYKGYDWYAGDVAQREAWATGRQLAGVTVPPPVQAQGLAPQPVAAPASAMPGSAPVAIVELGNVADPDQRRAVCGYLAAEGERLNHEFRQPLPPSVIDRIATEIAQWDAQTSRYGCASSKGQRGTSASAGAKK